VSKSLIDRVIGGLGEADAVVPGRPISDTLKRVAGQTVTETVSRDGLHAAETPQAFSFSGIIDAHRRAAAAGKAFTDDAAVAEWAGLGVRLVAGDPANLKLTTADEIALARQMVASDEAARLGDVRVGVGYDIHSVGPGHEVNLGGVAIPHSRGLVGHSDADVVLHALTDAILGALADGDIGEHFPNTDDKWRDAPSAMFLAEAVRRVVLRGGAIAHLDVALVAQGPRIAPYRDAMRRSIAEICGIAPDRVGVKATSNEGLGFIGRGEGMAAYATATIRLPLGRD
jgi:2-C-methyl-D-erythritol 4-phosphate cytidylyltransferase/2-C-methyl-D-erythritol 2,4-cyclodiphosphate synthase